MSIGSAYCGGANSLEAEVASWMPFSNHCYWSDPEVDDLIIQAYAACSTDKALEAELIIEAQAIVREACPEFTAVDLELLAASSTSISGFEGFKTPYPYIVDFYNVSVQ